MKQVTFKGGELVPRRALEVAEAMAPDNVEVITFKSLPAMEDFGRWYPETNTVLVNVAQFAQWAIEQIQESTNGLSFRAAMWIALMGTLAHEFMHAKQPNPETAAAEQEAQDFEEIAPFLWAKHIDMELPLNWGGMIDEILAFEASFDPESTHPWEITQNACMKGGLVWWDRSTRNCKFSFKQLAKDTLHDGDPKWDEILTPAPAGLDMIEDPAVAKEMEMWSHAGVTPPPPPPQNPTPQPAPVIEPEETPQAMMAEASQEELPFEMPLYSDDDDVYDLPSEALTAQAPVAQQSITTYAPVNTPSTRHNQYVPPQANPMPPPPPATPPHSGNEAVKAAAIREIMMRIHHHLYTKCGFAPGPTAEHRPFTNAGMVTEPIYIGDIPGHRDVVLGYDTVNGWGQMVVFNGAGKQEILGLLSKGLISGTVSKVQGLPMYTLYVNIGGLQCKRSLLPANPNKRTPDGSAWSKFAQEARMGIKRTMAMAPEGDPRLPKGGITSAVEEAPGGPATWRKW